MHWHKGLSQGIRQRVLTVIGRLVAAAMPQHVAVDEKAKTGSLTGSRNAIASSRQASLPMRRHRPGIVRSAALRRDAFSLLNGIRWG